MPEITLAAPLTGNVIRARYREPTDHQGSGFLVDGLAGAPRRRYPYDHSARNPALTAVASYLRDLRRIDHLTLTPLPDGPDDAIYFLVSRTKG